MPVLVRSNDELEGAYGRDWRQERADAVIIQGSLSIPSARSSLALKHRLPSFTNQKSIAHRRRV